VLTLYVMFLPHAPAVLINLPFTTSPLKAGVTNHVTTNRPPAPAAPSGARRK